MKGQALMKGHALMKSNARVESGVRLIEPVRVTIGALAGTVTEHSLANRAVPPGRFRAVIPGISKCNKTFTAPGHYSACSHSYRQNYRL